MPRIFTASDYWFEMCADILVQEGNLELTSRYWVVGLGSGFRTLHKLLQEPRDITGTAHITKVHIGKYRSIKVTTVAIAGGPIYTEWVVALAWRRGVRAMIGVGLCGALDEELEVGDVVVPTGAIREENTTQQYVPREYPAVPDYRLLRIVQDVLKEMYPELRTHYGVVLTTPATFVEEPDWGRRWNMYRVLAVECEVSVLYTLTYLANIPCIALLVVSDHVTKSRPYEELKKLEPLIAQNYEKIAKIALETLHRYAQARE
ncbi:MAG: hypothetical protein DRJ40_08965 [Thermoprotei archaeon]|nr:MAG: hypothetical protein DRJ40_08965 [Thermoprotei archaeon]